MRTIAALSTAIAVYLLWGFDMSAALTGWSVLRLIGALFLLLVAYAGWKRYREIQLGLHQWPDPKGPLYNEWLKIPADQPHADYYAWLAERKQWREPWATWAEWSGAKRPTFSGEVDRLRNELDQKTNAKAPIQVDPLTAQIIHNLNSTTLAEEEARQKSSRFRKRWNQTASQARERREK